MCIRTCFLLVVRILFFIGGRKRLKGLLDKRKRLKRFSFVTFFFVKVIRNKVHPIHV